MEKQQAGMILDLMDIAYPNKLKVSNEEVFFNTWFMFLQDYDYKFVLDNLNHHIKTSSFLPGINDLITDKRKLAIQGRYIPDAEETRHNMIRIEQERHLALTTSTTTVSSEELEQLKKETLRKLAEASKRNRENRDVYGGTV